MHAVHERTCAIIKPGAVARLQAGPIIEIIERNGFSIISMDKLELTREQAERFYAIHKERPFFAGLVQIMTSGPMIAMVLEKEQAIQEWRTLMGATDPLKAGVGTIRKMFGIDLDDNATHGSDSAQTAEFEIGLLFNR